MKNQAEAPKSTGHIQEFRAPLVTVIRPNEEEGKRGYQVLSAEYVFKPGGLHQEVPGTRKEHLIHFDPQSGVTGAFNDKGQIIFLVPKATEAQIPTDITKDTNTQLT